MTGDLSAATGEVSEPIVADPALVWALITDLARTPEWNRETLETTWVPPHSGAAVGAMFRATNRIGDWQWNVECHVTRADPGVAFEWTVMDPSHPSTRWWHRLEATADGTELRHGFQHGPGPSGLRDLVDNDPDHAAAIIAGRVQMLVANMGYTLGRIKALAEAGGPVREGR